MDTQVTTNVRRDVGGTGIRQTTAGSNPSTKDGREVNLKEKRYPFFFSTNDFSRNESKRAFVLVVVEMR